VKKSAVSERLSILAMVLFTNPAPTTGAAAPAIVYDFIERFHLLPRQASTLMSAELVGMALASIAGYWLVMRCDRRMLAALSIIIAIAGQLATLTFPPFPLLLAARLVAGFGSGMALSVGAAALAGTRDADRNFGWSIASQSIATAGIMSLVAFFNLGVNSGRTMVAFIGLLLLTAASLPWFPRYAEAATVRQDSEDVGAGFSSTAAFIGLFGVFLISGSFGTVWPMLGQIGLMRGDSPETISATFAVVGFGAIAGGLVAAWAAGKAPRNILISIGALGLAASAAMLALKLPFVGISLLVMIFWAFGITFVYGAMASLDAAGRLTVLIGAIVPIGIAAGQLLTASLTALPGFLYILGASVVLATVGLTALLVAMGLAARWTRSRPTFVRQ
jgi:predicted MFS family arabinose efflux permease